MSKNLIEFNDGNFKSEVMDNGGAVLVDFWAPWCGPCRMITPILEELADEYAGKIKIGKVNVDESQAVAREYGIQSIPTLLLFKEGKLIDRQIGALPKPHLEKLINSAL